LVDTACHGIEFCRWVMDKQPVKSVYAQLNTHLPDNNSGLEDDTIVIMEFGKGGTALIESSWALKGPVQSRAEILGTEGVIYADIVGGLQCFTTKGISRGSENGYSPATSQFGNKDFPRK